METVKRGILGVDNRDSFKYAKIADKFIEEFNMYCRADQAPDRKVMLELFQQYVEVWQKQEEEEYTPKQPVQFRPSSTGSDLRSLALLAQGAEEDKREVQAHQYRWTNMGTKTGDFIQETVLQMEKHFPRLFGRPCSFRFDRTEEGYPMFEEFSTTTKEFDGWEVRGSTDGIIIYTNAETGEETRLGLEVKSKSTTNARTSYNSLKEAEPSHTWQVRTYAELFDVDCYLVLYLNLSKFRWHLTQEYQDKYPDFRVFAVDTSKTFREQAIGRFQQAYDSAQTGELPKLDYTKWLFNGYKQACVDSLTDKELEELEQGYRNLPKTKKEAKMRADYKFMLDGIKERKTL